MELLKLQYESLETFANAQSRLLNAFMNKSSTSNAAILIAPEIEYMESCRQHVRAIGRQIHADDELCRKYQEHVDLSVRVVQTIGKNPSWDPMGIPSHSDGILQSNTVALAALRASLARIQELE